MYRRVLCTAIAALMGVSTVVQAEVLAGGPLYGGPASVGGTVTCRVFNAGGGSLSLDTREIHESVSQKSCERRSSSKKHPIKLGREKGGTKHESCRNCLLRVFLKLV